MLRLPVPRPTGHDPAFRELARLAQSLARTGIDADEQSYVQINSIAAALYGLTTSQYEHVVGTFPLLSERLRRWLIADYVQASEAQRHRGGKDHACRRTRSTD